jgi:hypothetical protein
LLLHPITPLIPYPLLLYPTSLLLYPKAPATVWYPCYWRMRSSYRCWRGVEGGGAAVVGGSRHAQQSLSINVNISSSRSINGVTPVATSVHYWVAPIVTISSNHQHLSSNTSEPLSTNIGWQPL